MPLRQFDVRHRLTSGWAAALGDARLPERLQHTSQALLTQRLYQIVAGYEDANDASLLRLLDADGILVVCCCSGLITGKMLDDLLAQMAAETRRDIQILERRGAAPDHPIAVTCPETDYLKCLICRVG